MVLNGRLLELQSNMFFNVNVVSKGDQYSLVMAQLYPLSADQK